MLRWSSKAQLAYVTMFCISLALTWLPYLTGGKVLIALVLAGVTMLPFALWWRIAVLASLSIAALFVVAVLRCVDKYASTLNEAANAEAFYQWWLPYVIQVGWLIGMTAAVLLYAGLSCGSHPND